MQLQHYANTPWRTINFTLEILASLDKPARLAELAFILGELQEGDRNSEID
jgi:hypothetical protein